MRNSVSRTVVSSLMLGTVGVFNSAVAQEAPDAAQLAEIVVTANKRIQNIQTTNVTITALSAKELEDKGVDNFEDIAKFVPGFDFQKQGVSQSQYVLRGASVSRVTPAEPQNRSLVGIYFNDVPLDMNGLNPDIDLFDTRVEVLKGPQGSLFGDSAMAGAVRYITNTPSTKKFEANLLANGSSIRSGGDGFDIKGMVNVPIVRDALAIRLVGAYRDQAGWSDNVRLGTKDTNTEKTTMFRAAIGGQLGAALKYEFTYLHQNTDAGTPPYDTDAAGTDGIRHQAEFSRLTNETIKDMVDLGALTLNHDFAFGTLTSVTSFQKRTVDNVLVELAEAYNSYFGNSPHPALYHDWDMNRFTQELRLTTSLSGPFNVTAGGYYSRQKIFFGNTIIYPGLDSAITAGLNPFDLLSAETPRDSYGCVGQVDTAYCGPETDRYKQLSLFGEAYFNVTDKLQLIAGGRHYHYDLDFFQDFAGLFNFGAFQGSSTSSENGFNPKFGVTYKANQDLFLYANAARGFRLGGVSNVLPSFCDADLSALGLTRANVASYRSDSLWSFEGGVKSTMLGGRMTANSAVYYTVWNDIQTPINLPCGYIPTTNAGKMRSYGLEGELRLAATSHMSFFGSFALNHASLVGDAPAVGGKDGDRAPYTPSFKGVLGLAFERAVSGSTKLGYDIDIKYQTKSYDSFTRTNELYPQFVGNARINADFDDRYRVSLYVNNLTNEYIANAARSRFGLRTYYVGQPRTIGLQVQAKY